MADEKLDIIIPFSSENFHILLRRLVKMDKILNEILEESLHRDAPFAYRVNLLPIRDVLHENDVILKPLIIE